MSSQTLKIINARVWLGTGIGWADREVLCDGAQIAEVAPRVAAQAQRTIDSAGLWLIPGVIDAHVHLREPGAVYKEDFVSGSIAAASGGVTTVLDMPNNSPPCTTVEALEDKQRLAAGKAIVNVGFFIGATPTNLEELVNAKSACGIKIFMGSSTGSLLVHEQFALEAIFGGTRPEQVIAVHCEDETRIRERTKQLAQRTDAAAHSEIRDNEVAAAACRRALELAARYKHRMHLVHVSTKDECELLRSCPAGVTAEVAPHHLWFTTDDYARLGAKLKMNPSLKARADVDALWAALKDGRIGMVATDHAPHTVEEKTKPDAREVPSGVPCVENVLGLMLACAARGLCSVEQVLAWCCEAPARAYRLAKKGRIATGMDADLVLVDPKKQHTIRGAEQFTKCKWSPWEGVSLSGGWPVTTIVRGQVAFERGAANLACRGTNPAG